VRFPADQEILISGLFFSAGQLLSFSARFLRLKGESSKLIACRNVIGYWLLVIGYWFEGTGNGL